MANLLSPSSLVPFPLPSAKEAAALAITARYLAGAGTLTASVLLGRGAAGNAALLASLRDSLLAAAVLCDGLLDLVSDRPDRL